MRRKEMRSNIELGPGENVVLNFVCGYILAVFCRSCIVKCFRNSNTKQIIFVKEFFKSIVFRKKNQIFMNLQIASKFNCKVLNLYNIILLKTCLKTVWKTYAHRCCSKNATRAYQNLLARITCQQNSDSHKWSADRRYKGSNDKRDVSRFLGRKLTI